MRRTTITHYALRTTHFPNKKSPLLIQSKGRSYRGTTQITWIKTKRGWYPRDGFTVVPPSFIFIRSTLDFVTQVTPAKPTKSSALQFRKELPYFLFTGFHPCRLSLKLRNTYFFPSTLLWYAFIVSDDEGNVKGKFWVAGDSWLVAGD